MGGKQQITMGTKVNLQTEQQRKGVCSFNIDAEGNYICTDKFGRQSKYPQGLVFTRKSGATYFHIGRTYEGFPTCATNDKIKSLETGKIKEMSEKELEAFKKG